MNKIIARLDKYFGDGERWHEWGVVCFFGVVIGAFFGMFQNVFFYAILISLKFALSAFQEIVVERKWKLTKENVTRDFWYDIFMRPLGSSLIALGFAEPVLVFVGLLVTYKFKFWDK